MNRRHARVKEDPDGASDRRPGAEGAASLPRRREHPVTTSDGTEIRLTHYALGTKGPIVLAPGYGNAARAFAVDTVPKNYVQSLGEHGYDVWLLDYRASPDLAGEPDPVHGRRHRDTRLAGGDRRGPPAHRRGLGPGDGPLRRRPVAVHGHRRRPEGLRSATFSSLAGHPIATPGNRLRAGAHLATMFKKLGIKGLNTDYDPDYLPDRAVELVMRALPSATSTTAPWAGASTSSTATSSTSRTSTRRPWTRPCRASSASATSRSSSTSRG